MAMYEPAYLPPDAEEQDFIQAYENVREKYKGGSDDGHSLMDETPCACMFPSFRLSVSRLLMICTGANT